MQFSDDKVLFLIKKAAQIRCSVIEMLINAGSGHIAGSLGMADIFAYLFFHALKHDSKKPSWEYRDRLILSNGHICPVLYSTMAHSGYFDISELMTLRKFGSRLQGHPHREWLPFLETSSGPLGSGLSQAIGMALSDRIDNGKVSGKKYYCLLSDGEIDEGNTWEAVLLAQKEKLNSLIAIVDRNGIQIDGNTEQIMPLDLLAEKWRSFNWNTIEINGHDFNEINKAFEIAKLCPNKPTVIIAHTIPSKGIPEFENNFAWHGRVPNNETDIITARKAVEVLKSIC